MPRRTLLASSALALVAACGYTRVVKVPYADAYDLTSQAGSSKNQFQARADAIKGFRYYLPRPYVVVNDEFAVAGSVSFVRGKVDSQGNIVDFEGAIDPTVKAAFGEKIPFDALVGGDGARAPQDSKDLQSEKKDEPAPPDKAVDLQILVDDTNVTAVTFAPSTAESATQVVDVTVEAKPALAAAAKSKSQGTTEYLIDKTVVLLVPVSGSEFKTAGVLELSIIKADPEKITLSAQVAADKAGMLSTAGVLVRPADAAAKLPSYVAVRKNALLVNPFAGAAPKKPDEGKKDQAKNISQTEATASGDPSTDPLVELDAPFDVLYLPDFSEQYAIQYEPGLGLLELDIGLENGWMLEKFHTTIDNTQVGTFVIDSLTKFIDAKLGLAEAAVGAIAGAPTRLSPEMAANLQSEQAGVTKQVVLKVIQVEYAVPGVYPILKPAEQARGANQPIPAPRVDWQTRKDTRVVVLSVETKPVPPAAGADERVREIFNEDLEFSSTVKELKFFAAADTRWKKLDYRLGPAGAVDCWLKPNESSEELKAEMKSKQEEIQRELRDVLGKKWNKEHGPVPTLRFHASPL